METLKDRIKRLRLDRKVLAARLRIPYSTLGAKLAGFNRFSPDQERQLITILDTCESVKREMDQRLDAQEVSPYAK